MSALSRKLRRDLWRIRAQVVSIAGVMAGGVMAVVALRGTSSALERSTAEYYATARFADVFASLTRAPDAVEARLAAVPGVASVATRRSARNWVISPLDMTICARWFTPMRATFATL